LDKLTKGKLAKPNGFSEILKRINAEHFLFSIYVLAICHCSCASLHPSWLVGMIFPDRVEICFSLAVAVVRRRSSFRFSFSSCFAFTSHPSLLPIPLA